MAGQKGEVMVMSNAASLPLPHPASRSGEAMAFL